MDRDRQAALRMRADEAMTAALAAADSSLGVVVADTMESINLVCLDSSLAPAARLALIDEALRLIVPLKELSGAARAGRAALIVDVVRRTNGMLRRYARLRRSAT